MSFVSQHFHLTELECPCCKTFVRNDLFIKALAEVREKFNHPMKITSGYRCAAHNKTIPGSSRHSRHVRGCAVDVSTFAWLPSEIFKFIKIASNMPKYGALYVQLGLYPTHIHFGIGPRSAAWVKG